MKMIRIRMKTMQTKYCLGRWGVGCLSLILAAGCAWGGLIVPLYISNVAPVRDQNGQPMRGSPSPMAEQSRCRIEIRVAPYGGLRYPPGKDGSASSLNPLVTPGSVGGVGLNAAQDDSGLFCMIFPERLPAGTLIFARAYNAPTIGETTFYADSKVVAIPSKDSTLVLDFESAQALDSDDADGDGLINSWERYLGTADRQTSDYDDDGMSDYCEMLAGTALTNPQSNLSFRMVRREALPTGANGSKPLHIKWQSVPGKRYQLQHVTQLLGEQEFIDDGEVVVARNGEFEIELPVDLPEDSIEGFFRVKLVQEGD